MFKSMKRIIRWAGKYRGRLYLGSVFSFFSSLSTAIPTMAAAYALDKSIQAYWAHTTIDASLIWKMLWIIVGSIALNFLFSYLRAILQERDVYKRQVITPRYRCTKGLAHTAGFPLKSVGGREQVSLSAALSSRPICRIGSKAA